MTEDDIFNMRLECLHLADRSCGEDVAYEYVLEAARAYVDFVENKKKPYLSVVRNDDEAG